MVHLLPRRVVIWAVILLGQASYLCNGECGADRRIIALTSKYESQRDKQISCMPGMHGRFFPGGFNL